MKPHFDNNIKELIHSISGLTQQQVEQSRKSFGSNSINTKGGSLLVQTLKNIVAEPMLILLILSCTIYFLVDQYNEGIIMLVAILIVSGISFYQQYRSGSAVKALHQISSSKVSVIRSKVKELVFPDDLVVDDIVLLVEGEIIPADGLIISANDFQVNESVLTGESFVVIKDVLHNEVFRGTLVTAGFAIVRLTAVGDATQYGKINKSLKQIDVPRTPMEIQIRSFVKFMALFGIIAFIAVVGYHFWQTKNFVQSLMRGLTLAMSVLPEEIPVAFSTFQALGAFRLLKNNIIVKRPQYVETLGSATVICVDKTGTLTKNEMSITSVYDFINQQEVQYNDMEKMPIGLIEYAMWSSEVSPYDPMEKAIHALYERITPADKRPGAVQVHEYPLGGRPPFMTHIFRQSNAETIIAAKGAPEAIIEQSNLNELQKEDLKQKSVSFARKGYRVLGVGKSSWPNEQWPSTQHQFKFDFLGLIVFDDPPKTGINKAIQTFLSAGITIKMLTGDYAETAKAIAAKVGMETGDILTGAQVMRLTETDLRIAVQRANIFARMFPDAKLKVIEALKANGEIVAMTGDGVNDAPALKAAHIGIAMGIKGSEAAKSVSALIITDDNLLHMTEAIAVGRKIYDNLKKAIRYIISIHIPIILIVLLPLVLGWEFTAIFSPVHVIFMELLMGPTCSIVYENEPAEPQLMSNPPRKLTDTFMTGRQLTISLVQGLLITAGCLLPGYYYLSTGSDYDTVRTLIFITLLLCNIMLTLLNRSFTTYVWKTLARSNRLIPIIVLSTLIFIFLVLYVPGLQSIFQLHALDLNLLLVCLVAAFISTAWIEIWKYMQRN